MSDRDPREANPTADPSLSMGAAPRRYGAEYLVAIDKDRSSVVTMPASGELVIGRDPNAGLTVDDPLVSRTHAQLLVVPEGLRLSDLGSRHGTLVNGERVEAPRLLGSGDVIAIGNALFVVRRPVRPPRPKGPSETAALVGRLSEELARAAQYERPVSLVMVRRGGDDPAELVAALGGLRAIDVTAVVGKHVAVLLPELDAEEAMQLARDLARRTRASAGVATAPFDGIDADAVLAAARAACDAASPGEAADARGATAAIDAAGKRIVVGDPCMAQLYELARRLARSAIPVLVLGETGAGKELAAAAVHAFSARANGPFVSVNCAAIPESLAESELFGHARGAFSGALVAKAGHVENAHGGTLFLDEIGELPAAIQAKLLRVLENGEVLRVGESKPRICDIRIVAATNRDLAIEVEAGRFRSDLFFRLGAARLELPPLRDRPRDLALLAATLLEDACAKLARPRLALSIGAALALGRHGWPGNVRELKHVIEYAAAAVPDGATEVEIRHLPAGLATAARAARDGVPVPVTPPPAVAPVLPQAEPGEPRAFRPIEDEVRELERDRMVAAMRATGGVQNRAAELIEMPLRTFVTKLKRYAVTAADWKPR